MKTRIPVKIFPIERAGYHIKLQVQINGKPAVFILDTGASKTVMDKAAVEHFVENPDMQLMDQTTSGIGTNTMESHLVVLKKFSVGKLELRNFKCAVLDLKHVNIAYEHLGLTQVAGVLGGDILKKYKAVINYATSTLQLEKKS